MQAYLSSIGSGFTLPQSAPLYTEEDSDVHSIGLLFGPACIDPTKWILPLACSSSVPEDSRCPLPLIGPVHTMSAVMPWSFLTRLITWQLPRDCGRMAPYL